MQSLVVYLKNVKSRMKQHAKLLHLMTEKYQEISRPLRLINKVVISRVKDVRSLTMNSLLCQPVKLITFDQIKTQIASIPTAH